MHASKHNTDPEKNGKTDAANNIDFCNKLKRLLLFRCLASTLNLFAYLVIGLKIENRAQIHHTTHVRFDTGKTKSKQPELEGRALSRLLGWSRRWAVAACKIS